jgi:phosphatidylinositol alpha 1,6-mannosyltransferase
MRRPVRCFVALGDSFTAGSEPGEARWPDEVADWLPGCRYVNLARSRVRSHEVADEQLPRALELEPDLVSLICGANDVLLTTRPDVPAFANTFSGMLGTLRSELPEAALVTATYPDVWTHFPLRPRSRERVARGLAGVNEAIRSAADDHDALCLEFAGHPARGERENYADDGFHPSPAGHRHAARAFALGLRNELGIEPEEAIA